MIIASCQITRYSAKTRCAPEMMRPTLVASFLQTAGDQRGTDATWMDEARGGGKRGPG